MTSEDLLQYRCVNLQRILVDQLAQQDSIFRLKAEVIRWQCDRILAVDWLESSHTAEGQASWTA